MSLADLLPSPLVKFAARRYVAGATVEDALLVARQNLAASHLTTLDLLGEGLTQESGAHRYVEAVSDLFETLGSSFHDRSTRPTVSLKPSMFGPQPSNSLYEALSSLIERADQEHVGVTLDMEDSRWTDFTLDLACDLYKAGKDVGTVLQTRLNRTESDLRRIPPGMRLRLVIGIYPERREIAIANKTHMKQRLVRYAHQLLAQQVFVEYATHDRKCVVEFLSSLAPDQLRRIELQFLYGVPVDSVLAALEENKTDSKIPVRWYVPYGLSWDDMSAYLRRRLKESPGILPMLIQSQLRRTLPHY